MFTIPAPAASKTAIAPLRACRGAEDQTSSPHLYLLKALFSRSVKRMSETVEVSRDVFEPITMLVEDGLFKDEKDALRSLVLDQAASKIRHFGSLIEAMRAKYDMSFEEFEERIRSRKGAESFDEWDDFIIWESYESAREYWAGVQANLKGVKE
jgi:hypothetical protein